MKWIEQHWVLAVVLLVVIVYLYNAYGTSLLGGGGNTNTLPQS